MSQMMVGKDVRAVIQAVSILRVMADANTPMGVTALARSAGVSPSTTLNILRTLIGQGVAGFSEHSKTYRLELGLLELARSLLNRIGADVLQPDLQTLAERFEATVTVWQWQGDTLWLVKRVVPHTGVHIEFPIAGRVSAHAGASGRLVFAYSDYTDAEIRQRVQALKWNSPVPIERYLKQVQQARRRGYAVDAGNFLRSVMSVAAAIRDTDGKLRLAVSMHTFMGQLSPSAIAELGHALSDVCRRNEGAL